MKTMLWTDSNRKQFTSAIAKTTSANPRCRVSGCGVYRVSCSLRYAEWKFTPKDTSLNHIHYHPSKLTHYHMHLDLDCMIDRYSSQKTCATFRDCNGEFNSVTFGPNFRSLRQAFRVACLEPRLKVLSSAVREAYRGQLMTSLSTHSPPTSLSPSIPYCRDMCIGFQGGP